MGCQQSYTIARENQSNAFFEIYCGNGEHITDEGMMKMSELVVDVPPKVKPNGFRMKVTISVDRSGVMKVQVEKERNGWVMGLLEFSLQSNDRDEKIDEMK